MSTLGTTAGGQRVPTGLNAFPLTPISPDDDGIDERAFRVLVRRLVDAEVDAITVLGSTGSYAYLDRDERRRAIEVATDEAGETPVLAGVGHVRTRNVLQHVDDAQSVGVAGLLVAPLTYQPLGDAEVYGLFADVDAAASVPVVVYDNPTTTRVTFTDDLHARIAELPSVASLKIPPVAGGDEAVRQRVGALRAVIPGRVSIGISGDPVAAQALGAGCDTWYSVLAGTLPAPCLDIAAAVAAGRPGRAVELSSSLGPLWRMFTRHGSYRVVSAIASELGLVSIDNLPRPVHALDGSARDHLRGALREIGRAAGTP